MKANLYSLKSLFLAFIFLTGLVLGAEAQVVGEYSFMPTHDTDIGTGNNNIDVGHKNQLG